jgi:CheY-like chemotaxis protein
MKHAERMEGGLVGAVRPGLRVLTAEDNLVNQKVVLSILELVGLTSDVVADGVEAVEAWRTCPYDLILMDVQMPRMDGVTATRTIREEEGRRGRPRTPIIAVTANAEPHEVAEYLASGMDAVAPKPIQVSVLFRTIEEVLIRARAAAPPARRAEAG